MTDIDAWIEANWDPELTVRAWWRRLAEAGYAHPSWPIGAGGLGLPVVDARAITAVLARHGVVGPPTGHLGAALAAPTIIEHGTAEQLRDLVLPIALGESAWCQLFSEPGAGSDLPSLSTRAVRDGDDWVVSGQKVWNSSAHLADMGMLLARTDPSAPKHRGITYFAVDMHQPGIEVRPLRVMNGTSPFCEVFLDGARVPAHRVVGAVDDGWRVAKTTMRHERATVAGGGFAGLVPARSGSVDSDLDRTCREVLERAAALVRERQSPIRAGAVPARAMVELARTHGRASDPVTRQELARYWTHVKVNGWTMRRSASARGRLTAADGSIAKLSTARICQESMQLSYRIAGAALLLSGPESPFGGDLQAVNLASPGNRIGGGTDEVQLNTLGERALGLPRDQSG